MTLEHELLTAKREGRINKELSLIDHGAPLSGDAEKRIASLAYINADFTSGMALMSGLLGVTSIIIAIAPTGINGAFEIILGLTALALLVVTGGAAWKLFNRDTAKQVAFNIHQQRCADLKSSTDSEAILAGIAELKKHKAIQPQESVFKDVAPTKNLNTKLWLSLLVVIAVTARKRCN